MKPLSANRDMKAERGVKMEDGLRTANTRRRGESRADGTLFTAGTVLMLAAEATGYRCLEAKRKTKDGGETVVPLKNKVLEDMFAHDVAARLAACCRIAAETGSPAVLENAIPLSDEPRPGRAVITPLYDPLGMSGHVVVAVESSGSSLKGWEPGQLDLLESLPDAVLIGSADGRILYCNSAFEEIFGYARAEIVGLHRDDLPIIPEWYRPEMKKFVNDLEAGSIIRNRDTVRRHKDGRLFDMSVSLSSVRDEWGRIAAFTCLYRNISEQKRAEAAARESDTRYRLIAENMTDLIALSDTSGRFVFVSPSYRKILGWEPEALVGRSSCELIHPEDRSRVQSKLGSMVAPGGTRAVEYRYRKADGGWLWVEVRYTPLIADGQSQFVMSVARDVSERKLLEERVADMTYHDMGTGAANLRLFKDRLEQAVLAARRYRHKLALLYLNLDDFRVINDSYGSTVGDKLLREVVKRLEETIGDTGTLGRLAGDEFTIVLHECETAEEAYALGERLVARLNTRFLIDETPIFITGSVGIACFPEHSENGVALIDCAHAAMYRAKEKGKNNCHMYESS